MEVWEGVGKRRDHIIHITNLNRIIHSVVEIPKEKDMMKLVCHIIRFQVLWSHVQSFQNVPEVGMASIEENRVNIL